MENWEMENGEERTGAAPALFARALARDSVEVLEIPAGESPPEGFLPFAPSDPPATGGTDTAIPRYATEGGTVVQRWEVLRDDPAMARREIERLRAELAAGDYKTAKCYEASLLGMPPPYDMNGLHQERQAARDRINELERLAEKRT